MEDAMLGRFVSALDFTRRAGGAMTLNKQANPSLWKIDCQKVSERPLRNTAGGSMLVLPYSAYLEHVPEEPPAIPLGEIPLQTILGRLLLSRRVPGYVHQWGLFARPEILGVEGSVRRL
jgi:hypothetical protein